MQYRRLFVPGGMYFFTLVTYKRRPIFSSPEAVDLLRYAFQRTQQAMPFIVVASVILPDHMHFIWKMLSGCSDFSSRWKLIKFHFSRNWAKIERPSESASRQVKGEADIWQRRFWEHLIRDEDDLYNHLDYIHFNPVKHGLAASPADWKYSSFSKFVKDGYYPLDWAAGEQTWQGDPRME